jgi:anti-sigma factor RsiW
MTCRDLAELLLEYVQGELDAERCAHIRGHLSSCPPCEAYVETYRMTIRLSRQLPAAPMPPELVERLRAALRDINEKS